MKTIHAQSPPDPRKRPGGPPAKNANRETDDTNKEEHSSEGRNEPEPKSQEDHHRSITNQDEQRKITNTDSDALEEKEQEGI